jgi:hypothetical protein
VKCVKDAKAIAINLSVNSATKGLAMVQRAVTPATPVLAVAVMMKADGLLEIVPSSQSRSAII